MTTRDISLEVAADPALLCSVRSLVRQYMQDSGVPKRRINDVVLGVDEACSNAIRHAYEGDPAFAYRVTLMTTEDWVSIQIEDDGKTAPESTFQAQDPAEVGAEGVTPGGLGVGLIQRVFDEVEHCAGEECGNCIIMKIRRKLDAG